MQAMILSLLVAVAVGSPTLPWVWWTGASTPSGPVAGDSGEFDGANQPAGRTGSLRYTKNMTIVLYGGYLYQTASYTLEDLWLFDVETSLWAWEGGISQPDQIAFPGKDAVYGSTDTWYSYNVSTALCWPGSRMSGAVWAHGSEPHQLYLFGGEGPQGDLNDLWIIDLVLKRIKVVAPPQSATIAPIWPEPLSRMAIWETGSQAFLYGAVSHYLPPFNYDVGFDYAVVFDKNTNSFVEAYSNGNTSYTSLSGPSARDPLFSIIVDEDGNKVPIVVSASDADIGITYDVWVLNLTEPSWTKPFAYDTTGPDVAWEFIEGGSSPDQYPTTPFFAFQNSSLAGLVMYGMHCLNKERMCLQYDGKLGRVMLFDIDAQEWALLSDNTRVDVIEAPDTMPGFRTISTLRPEEPSYTIESPNVWSLRDDADIPLLFGMDEGGRMWIQSLCPLGHYDPTEAHDVRSCVECPAGTVAGINDTRPQLTVCSPCAAGKYSNATGAIDDTVCSDCSEGTFAAAGSSECADCPAGRFSTTSTVGAMCQECSAGSSSLPGSSFCDIALLCPPGTAGDYPVCEMCIPGRFAPTAGSGECLRCEAGAVSASNASSCSTCPAGSFANEAQTECIACAAGTWNAQPGQTVCLSCPQGYINPNSGASSFDNCTLCPNQEGLVCPERSAAWEILNGFFRIDNTVFKCSPPEACLQSSSSASTTVCATGFEGPRCGSCSDGYYRLGLQCLPCGASATMWVLVFLAVLALVAVLLTVVRQSTGQVSHLKNSLRIILMSTQIIALYPSLATADAWPRAITSFFDVIAVSNLKFDMFAPECGARITYWDKWRFVQSIPVAFLLCFIATFVLINTLRPQQHRPWQTFMSGYVYIFLSIYTFVAASALEPLNCIAQPDGTSTMAFNPSVNCFSEEWNSYMPQIISSAVFYCLIIPGALVIVFWRNRDVNTPSTFTMLFGPIIYSYKEQYYYWDLVTLLKRVLVVLFVQLVYTYARSSTGFKVFSIFVLLLAFLLVHGMVNPYKRGSTNRLVLVWSILEIVFVVSGVLFVVSDLTDAESSALSLSLVTIFCSVFVHSLVMLLHRIRRPHWKQTQFKRTSNIIELLFAPFSPASRQVVVDTVMDLPLEPLQDWIATHEETRLPGALQVDQHDSWTDTRYPATSKKVNIVKLAPKQQ